MKGLTYDYVEYYVGMAKMVAYWHVKAMGFDVLGYRGPEQGYDTVSFLLKKNDIKLIITSSATPNNYPVVSFVDRHGNGVKKVSIEVENIEKEYERLVSVNAILDSGIYEESDANGTVKKFDVKLFDDNLVTFSNYSEYKGDLLPGFVEFSANWSKSSFDSGLAKVDHIACALRKNETLLWEPYVNAVFASDTVFELKNMDGEESKLDLQLKILQSSNKTINNVLVEPKHGGKKTQVQHFIEGNHGSGIQHIAFETEDIIATVKSLKEAGIEFVEFPDEYYKIIQEKYPSLDVQKFKDASILCELKDEGLLLQTFTHPIGDRPTFFYEVIQRVNAYEGFGIGNITSLFEAVERLMD